MTEQQGPIGYERTAPARMAGDDVLRAVRAGRGDPFRLVEHEVFQQLFGSIMTVLIALEFKHSILQVAIRRNSVVSISTVVLIGIIAISRKFVIPDVTATSAATIAAPAVALLVLGIVYWLLRRSAEPS